MQIALRVAQFMEGFSKSPRGLGLDSQLIQFRWQEPVEEQPEMTAEEWSKQARDNLLARMGLTRDQVEVRTIERGDGT